MNLFIYKYKSYSQYIIIHYHYQIHFLLHSIMALSVIRTKGGLVKPGKETPLTTLDLSVIDRLPVLRCNARTLHVFKHGPQATRVIREALSKALVPYYPLAGRLQESQPGCLQIQCTGDGVWYVEASSHCTLQSLHFFDDVQSIPYDDLLPDAIPESQGIDPLVQMQVYHCHVTYFLIAQKNSLNRQS